jgi:DNA polymerase-3 subunit epsilon
MNVKVRFVLAVGILAVAVVAAVGLTGAGIWSSIDPDDQRALGRVLGRVLGEQVAFLVVAGVLLLGLLGALVARAFSVYVLPLERLAAEIRLVAAANPDHRVEIRKPSEFAELAAAVNELADRYRTAEQGVADKIAAARSDLEEERNRLAALMSELSLAVLVCNVEGRILLYNEAARELLDPGGRGNVGLGRSVFGIVDRELISHALDRVQAGSTSARLATAQGDQLLGVRVAAVPAADSGLSGFVLTLEDLTRRAEITERRDALFRALTEGTRAPLGALRAAIESMLDYPDMDAAQRHRFAEIVRDEALRLSDHIERALDESTGYLSDPWLREDVLGRDLLAAAERSMLSRHEVTASVAEPEDDLWLEADSHAVVRAVTDLAGRLRIHLGIDDVRFSLLPAGRYAALDLGWKGQPLDAGTLREWTDQSAVGNVLERHGGEAWSGADGEHAYVRLLLPLAEVVPTPPAPAPRPRLAVGSRPEFYDFDLFRAAERDAAWGTRRLDELAYTVFDTETTGLSPSLGDEIVSIGAVRIVNGRLLRQETYEQFVDPGRPVSAASRSVHGITEDMLVGQPRIETVLPAFAHFAGGSVLVGHNLAFDLKFLKLKEESTGVRLTQPVLDTLLLSPVVHPDHEDHSLDAIAERLGVSILGRHTALGDAILTGKVFVRLLGLLAARGIVTLDAALEAARRTYQSRVSETMYKRY